MCPASGSDGELPICVLGPHRSGTSLATRIIGLLGIDLGPEDRMLPVSPHDNPKGYWEQAAVPELNDRVLAALGGGPYDPPALPPGWEQRPELEPLADEARALVAECFGGRGRWCWKDPRTSLTLPFWRHAAGEFAYVVCLRNPVEAAASHSRRDAEAFPPEKVLPVVLRYAASALRHTEGHRRTLLFYEDWFSDPDRQLEKIADFVLGGAERPTGWKVSAREFFDESLRRNHVPEEKMTLDPAIPPEIRAFYAALRSASGAGKPGLVEAVVPDLDIALHTRLDQETRIARLERELAEGARSRSELAERVAAAEARASAAECAATQHRAWLDSVQSSLSWRLTAPLRTVKQLLGAREPGR